MLHNRYTCGRASFMPLDLPRILLGQLIHLIVDLIDFTSIESINGCMRGISVRIKGKVLSQLAKRFSLNGCSHVLDRKVLLVFSNSLSSGCKSGCCDLLLCMQPKISKSKQSYQVFIFIFFYIVLFFLKEKRREREEF